MVEDVGHSPAEWQCQVCLFIYSADIPFEGLPDDWSCPKCRSPKKDFILKGSLEEELAKIRAADEKLKKARIKLKIQRNFNAGLMSTIIGLIFMLVGLFTLLSTPIPGFSPVERVIAFLAFFLFGFLAFVLGILILLGKFEPSRTIDS